MKKVSLIITLFICCLSTAVLAQNNSFAQANELYGKGKYQEAAALYESILKTQGVAPELYYNLGNAYYKMNETGLSILNYERALRLSPRYENAKVNLELAQLRVVDNVKQISTFFVKRWIEVINKTLTSNQWLFLSVSLFALTIVFVLLFIFSYSQTIRRSSFYFALILFIISMVSVTFSYVRKNQLDAHKEAIIMVGTVTAKSSPDKSGTILFQLHEGTKVSIESYLGNWTEIKLGNGDIGWIENTNYEVI